MILDPILVFLLLIAVQGTSSLGVEELIPIAIVSLSSHIVRAKFISIFTASPYHRLTSQLPTA